ncbi:hypothetical protein LGM71_29315 [Burkholderia sp. AU33545]|uniref:hypothetical protein n=1 Tax=Burkholderia sp. AU33545 TaxID=2879631 RepID=UPI001CF542A8|nr:hypothetical protein [Burkholderia sp. AU33545]MCA8205142.1 hypothetical protein [Burkholderia sp. AU33545]
MASCHRTEAMARFRVALSKDALEIPQLPGLASIAAQAHRYRPHVVERTQDVSVLQAQYSNAK